MFRNVITIVSLVLLVGAMGCQKKPQMQPEANVDQDITDAPEAYGPTEPSPLDPAVEPFPADPPADPRAQEPRPEPQPIDVVPPEVQKTYHVMKRGDTLYSLARQYYGDAKRWRDIAQANNIQDANNIPIGKRLVIPE